MIVCLHSFFSFICITRPWLFDNIESFSFALDDECDGFGIQMVKLQDPVLAKRYGIKTFPSLVYFRNGNPLTFDGNVLVLIHQLSELTLK
jgi:hypothetical protein